MSSKTDKVIFTKEYLALNCQSPQCKESMIHKLQVFIFTKEYMALKCQSPLCKKFDGPPASILYVYKGEIGLEMPESPG